MTIRNRITVNGKTEYAYRVIMEKHIGRKLKPGECVHHKDGNPLNDSIENLELCASNTQHKSEKHRKYAKEFPCGICGKIHLGEVRRKFHFCSRLCWKKSKIGGRPITNGTGKTVTADCSFCGKQFTGKRNISRKLFCSHACYSKSLIKS